MLAITLAVITMASGATALTSHAEDFTEVAEVEEMTLSARVAEQLEEKELAGEISAKDVATTIQIAENVEEMRSRDMISDEDMLEWGQVLVGNYDTNGISTYASSENDFTSYDYYSTASGLCPTKHYLAILNRYKVSLGEKVTVTYYMHTGLSTGGSYLYHSNLGDPEISSGYSSDGSIIRPMAQTLTVVFDKIDKYSNLMRYQIPISTAVAYGINSEYALHCYTSSNPSNPSADCSNEGYELKKCVYALGDIDRSGRVDATDSLEVTKFAQGFYGSTTKKTEQSDSYNEAAFKLVADVDSNGTVDLEDAQQITNYVLGKASVLR